MVSKTSPVLPILRGFTEVSGQSAASLTTLFTTTSLWVFYAFEMWGQQQSIPISVKHEM